MILFVLLRLWFCCWLSWFGRFCLIWLSLWLRFRLMICVLLLLRLLS